MLRRRNIRRKNARRQNVLEPGRIPSQRLLPTGLKKLLGGQVTSIFDTWLNISIEVSYASLLKANSFAAKKLLHSMHTVVECICYMRGYSPVEFREKNRFTGKNYDKANK